MRAVAQHHLAAGDRPVPAEPHDARRAGARAPLPPARVTEELERRGIKRATATPPAPAAPKPRASEPQWTEWVCPHTPACESRWRCHQQTEMEKFRAAEARGEG